MTSEAAEADRPQPHPDDSYPFLRHKLDEVAAKALRIEAENQRRHAELMEANNRYLERARAAEARVRELEAALGKAPAFSGFGVKTKAGEIDIRTVSPTERAAKVNGVILAGYFLSNDASDEYIDAAWEGVAKETGAEIVPVLIKEAGPQ